MQKNKSGIYKIENLINGKAYVGSSLNLVKRKNNHFSALRRNAHHSNMLQNAFNKYGEANFEFSVLEYCNEEELETKEQRWIVSLNSHERDFGYNARIYVSNNRGLRHSEETKEKISRSRTGKGKHKYQLTEEARRIKSERCISQNLSQYKTEATEEKRLARLRDALCGKPISDEHKSRISESNRGSNNGAAKLTEESVKEIKLLLRDGGKKISEIAKIYEVSPRNIRAIRNGSRWAHVKIA